MPHLSSERHSRASRPAALGTPPHSSRQLQELQAFKLKYSNMRDLKSAASWLNMRTGAGGKSQKMILTHGDEWPWSRPLFSPESEPHIQSAHKEKNPLNSEMAVGGTSLSNPYGVRSYGAIARRVCQDRWRQLAGSPRPELKVSHRVRGLNFRQRDFQTLIHAPTHPHTCNDPGLSINTNCNCECLRHLVALCGQLENGIWRTTPLQIQWNNRSTTASPLFFSLLHRRCILKEDILKMEDKVKKNGGSYLWWKTFLWHF